MATQAATSYDGRYASDGFYWGTRPSALCDGLIDRVHPSTGAPPSLIDLGCGEGRNAVYLARLGFHVTGLDISRPGLDKVRRLASESGVEVETVHADIRSYELGKTYDVIFSTGLVHYLPPAERSVRFEHFKTCTTAGGWNAHSALVGKPFLEVAPDASPNAVLFTSGELMGYYWDWEIVYCVEEIFDCRSDGIPHRHAVNRIIARKPGGGLVSA